MLQQRLLFGEPVDLRLPEGEEEPHGNLVLAFNGLSQFLGQVLHLSQSKVHLPLRRRCGGEDLLA